MEKNIKKIEDMSLNAWPSHKMELYDGWILRFSYFYTHRTNSVEQFGNSMLPWREKVAYCENVYKRLGSPAIFKISPVVSPDFDYTLENRGYEIQHTTEVMTMALSDAHIDTHYPDVTLTNEIPDIWINSLFDLKGMTNPIHRAVPCTVRFRKRPSVLLSGKRARSSLPVSESLTVTTLVSTRSMSKKNTVAGVMPARSVPLF